MLQLQKYAKQRQERNRIIKQQLNKIVSLKSTRQIKQSNRDDEHTISQQQSWNKTHNNACIYQYSQQQSCVRNEPLKQAIEQQQHEKEQLGLMINRQDADIEQQRKLQEQNLILKELLQSLEHQQRIKINLHQQQIINTNKNDINQKQFKKIKTQIQSIEKNIYATIEQMQIIQYKNKNLERQIFMSEGLMNQSLQEKSQFYQQKIKEFLKMFELLNLNINLMELQQQNNQMIVVKALSDSEIITCIENKVLEADPDIETKLDDLKKKLGNLIKYSKQIQKKLQKQEKEFEKLREISGQLYNKITQNKFQIQMQKEENRKRGQNLGDVKKYFSQIFNFKS